MQAWDCGPHSGRKDLFVVPTISFRLLYGLLIMGHDRRQILWFGVTARPTAGWIAASEAAPIRRPKRRRPHSISRGFTLPPDSCQVSAPGRRAAWNG
jgi:hypothetical protein